MRGPGAAVATLISMLAIAAGAFALPKDAELGRMAADGPITITSSSNGTALLHGEGIMPGDTVTGLITLTNAGDKPGTLALTLGGLRDRPGFYGGRLSSVLRLQLDDLTGGGAAVNTTLARTAPLVLADLKGRQARTYKVTATFPDTGVPPGPGLGDNAQQGSSVEVAMTWQLTEKAPAVPKPPTRPVTPPAGGGGVAPAPGPTPSGQPPKLVTLRVPAQRVLKPRKLKVYASCEVRCRLQFNAKIDNAPKPAKKAKRAKGRRVLMGRTVIKKQKRWVTLKRVGREKRYSLKLTRKALRKLRKQLHRKGRVGITVTARMRSAAGNRVVRRRIVMRTYKKGERAKPAPLR
jgi:hypothetical protein